MRAAAMVWLMAMAACGDSTVRVTVLVDRVPRGGLLVVVGEPDGAVRSTATTDDVGSAVLDVPRGGSVTSVFPGEASSEGPIPTRVESILGVEPGDTLSMSFQRTTVPFTVSWPEGPPGTASYEVYARCARRGYATAPTQTVTIDVDPSCGDTMEIVVAALNASSRVISFDNQSGIPLVSGGSVTMNLSFASPISVDVDVTNLGDDFRAAGVVSRFPNNGFPTMAQSGSATTWVLGNSPVASTAWMAVTAYRILSLENPPPVASKGSYERIPGDATTYTPELEIDALPLFTEETRLDLASHSFTTAPGGPFNLLTYSLHSNAEWLVVSPNTPSVTLPRLPKDAGVTEPTSCQLTAYVVIDVDYDELRQTVGTTTDHNGSLSLDSFHASQIGFASGPTFPDGTCR